MPNLTKLTPDQIITQTTAQLPQRIQQSSANNQTEELKQLIHITATKLKLTFDCITLKSREIPDIKDIAELWKRCQQHSDDVLTIITHAKEQCQLGNTVDGPINDILEIRRFAQFRHKFLSE